MSAREYECICALVMGKRVQIWESEVDGADLVRAMLEIMDHSERVPVFGVRAIRQAKAALGLRAVAVNKEWLHRWQIAPDWPARLEAAGIDPRTRRLVDLEKWRVFCQGVEQARVIKREGKSRAEDVATLKKAFARYSPAKPLNASELLAEHARLGMIARHLRSGQE